MVSANPRLAIAELGRGGYASFDVTDVRRPNATDHIWDPDISLASYIDCLKTATADYLARTPGVDLMADFDWLVFHTPFPGAVKGAHRSLLRALGPMPPTLIAEDFSTRMADSIRYPAEVGNLYAGTTLLALASLLDHTKPGEHPARIGLFSYGSGCSSEFCSYLRPAGAGDIWDSGIAAALNSRTQVTAPEYDVIADAADALYAGVADYVPETASLRRCAGPLASLGPQLMLTAIRGHERIYGDVAASDL